MGWPDSEANYNFVVHPFEENTYYILTVEYVRYIYYHITKVFHVVVLV